MRLLSRSFAVAGGVALLAAVLLAVAAGHWRTGGGWLLAVPVPVYAAGLLLIVRRPDDPISAWLMACGALLAFSAGLGELLHLVPSPATALARDLARNATAIAGMCLVGLFPTGRTRSRAEFRVLAAASVIATLLPVLSAASQPILPLGLLPGPAGPEVGSPLFQPALAWIRHFAEPVQYSLPLWTFVGLAMLSFRYRHATPADRRRIRWFVAGAVAALAVWSALFLLAWASRPPGTAASALWALDPAVADLAALAVWPLVVVSAAGALLAVINGDTLDDLDLPARRAVIRRALWVLIALVQVALAAALGIAAARVAPVGVAVLLAAASMQLFEPLRHRLHGLADAWIFGARLTGYEILSRFGDALAVPGDLDELLTQLADTIRHGLRLRWAGVTLGTNADRTAGSVIPLVHAGRELGRIECGPRLDGPLLDEDRRLLEQLAGRAATAIRNLQLTGELTASRARIAAARDSERRRIQRDLHDGVQQELVALTATLATARERLRRNDPRAGETLDEGRAELAALLGNLREFAHHLHPPVLADRGLVPAVEAHAARLPVEVVVRADPRTREERFPRHLETAAWYLLNEALTNAVKHSGASTISVSVRHDHQRLSLEVADDGCGFDPRAPRGLGLTGLDDRMSIVDGWLEVHSEPGGGTRLRAEIPLPPSEEPDARSHRRR